MSVTVRVGDIFTSDAQTLVNTVNTVGVMGKGIALGFKKRFPEMYGDYVRRCEQQQVHLGEPYVFKRAVPPWIINFPTKEHWRSTARTKDIVAGLAYLHEHVREWGVTSLAVPPLGCGEGRLEWRVVGRILYHRLSLLDIPVELFAPHGTPAIELTPEFLREELTRGGFDAPGYRERIKPAWVALVEILWRIVREPYHWPVGRTTFQKIAYFATELGVPTGIDFGRGPYGPFAEQLKGIETILVNNDLLSETKAGDDWIQLRPGDSHFQARQAYNTDLLLYEQAIAEVADLFLRMNARDAEVAATIHFVWKRLPSPTESDILRAVQRWKARRRPPLSDEEIAIAIRTLNSLGLIAARYSADLPVPERATA